MKRPTNFDAHIAAINSSVGQSFTTSDAGDKLLKAGLIPTKDPATAVVYASLALRYLLEVQDDCPEADQLTRVSNRYVFAPSIEQESSEEVKP